MSSRTLTALTAARAAGDLLRQKLSAPRTITDKGTRDIVTDADVAAQQIAVEIIRADFPQDAILAEEGLHEAALHSPIPTWILDPLDGTSNYARQFPVFGTSIGVAQNGVIQCGAIYDPLGDELFFAAQGTGAFVRHAEQDTPLRVSSTTELIRALIGLDWSRDPVLRRRTLAGVTRLAEHCLSLRAIGSAALGLAYVAAGRQDAYFHYALYPWDVAAGVVLITEAGGAFTTPSGAPWQLGEPSVLLSNRRLHPELTQLLAEI